MKFDTAAGDWFERVEGALVVGNGAEAPGDAWYFEALELTREGYARTRGDLDGLGLDGGERDEEAVARRAGVLERVTELSLAIHRRWREHPPSGDARAGINDWLEEVLTRDREELSAALTGGDDSGSGAGSDARKLVYLDGLHRELRWWSLVLGLLDGDYQGRPLQGAVTELERLGEAIRDGARSEAAIEAEEEEARRRRPWEEARARSREDWAGLERAREGLEWRVSGLALEQDLTPPGEEAGFAELWMARFPLSRAQGRLEALLAAGDGGGTPGFSESEARARIEGIARAREALAVRALEAMLAAGPSEELEWNELATFVQGERNDLIAAVEELSHGEAVALLGRSREDLEVLEEQARRAESSGTGGRTGPTIGMKSFRRRLRSWANQARNQAQERRLEGRLEGVFGRRFTRGMELTVLALIVLFTAMLALEGPLESMFGETGRAAFAWADLAICSVFLAEFGLRLAFAEGRWLYFRRHFWIDLVPSLPYGFAIWQLDRLGSGAESAQALRLLRLFRIPLLLRYLRALRPLIRFARLTLTGLRLLDRLVRRNAGLLNRNIVFFSGPERDAPYSSNRKLLSEIREHCEDRAAGLAREAGPRATAERARAQLGDLEAIAGKLRGATGGRPSAKFAPNRSVRIERVIEALLEMTPEEVVDRMGQGFADSVERYVGMLDAPLIRSLPGIRGLTTLHGEVSAAELTALAANSLGSGLQRGLSAAYYVADLMATISPPLLLDRIGSQLVNSTKYQPRRLINMAIFLGAIWLLIGFLPMETMAQFGVLERFNAVVVAPLEKMTGIFTGAALALGGIYFLLWRFGLWLTRLGNQESEARERLVDAQFATQTRLFKREHAASDARFLRERVTGPEHALRSSDDEGDSGAGDASESESRYLRTVRLLYNDYLEGSPLHRNDTRSVSQLIGNPALANLRLSDGEATRSETRELNRLDLNQTGLPIIGGPFVWFTYITRRIVHETARLILEYNRNCAPLARLASAPAADRERYRGWLAGRLGVEPGSVELPAPRGALGGSEEPPPPTYRETERAREFFEVTDFTAMDFLARVEGRDEEIRARFGDRVSALLARDRIDNIRSAFRSYPLEQLPLSRRAFNPYAWYDANVARGKIVTLPFRFAWWLAKGAWLAVRGLFLIVREVRNPGRTSLASTSVDSYEIALRKIHRMRKPIFLNALKLRSRFDCEYLGLRALEAPFTAGSDGLLEMDLDYIGATRHERAMADLFRRRQERRLRRIEGILEGLGLTGAGLRRELESNFPYLTNRRGEVSRALAMAMLVNYRDTYALGVSLDALTKVMRHASRADHKIKELPGDLPEPVHPSRDARWFRGATKRRRPLAALFAMPGFPETGDAERTQILRYLQAHRKLTRGWLEVTLTQGGMAPFETLKRRLREIILRTDLWSEQLVVLRTVQSLTMLDVHHYCEMVWRLGSYEELEPGRERGLSRLPRLSDRVFAGVPEFELDGEARAAERVGGS